MTTGMWRGRPWGLMAAVVLAAAVPGPVRAGGDGPDLTLPALDAPVRAPTPGEGGALVRAAAQEPAPGGPSRPAEGPAPPSATPAQPPEDTGKRSNILDLDIDALAQVEVKAPRSAGPRAAAPTATGSVVT